MFPILGSKAGKHTKSLPAVSDQSDGTLSNNSLAPFARCTIIPNLTFLLGCRACYVLKVNNMKLSYFLLPLLLHATCAWSDDAKVNKVSRLKSGAGA